MSFIKRKKNIKEEKERIEELGLNAIKEYFEIDVEGIDKDLVKHIHQKAKMGLTFEKEMNLSKRAIEMNYLRVFRMIAKDKKELRKLIKKSLPQYV